MKITFAEDGWSEYLYWQTQDKKTLNAPSAGGLTLPIA